MVKQIVEQAKAGDAKAVKLFLEYIVGVKTAPTKISIHNHFPDVESAARAEKVSRRLNGSRLPAEE